MERHSNKVKGKGRRVKFVLLFAFCLLFSANHVSGQANRYTKYVDPLIGTGGHGHTFPGSTVPFGFVQLSPDTRVDNWDGSSGYHYSDNIIYGFSHTHLSGTGIPDYADILFSPYVTDGFFFDAKPEDTENGYASKFSHKNEKAEPGYYSVLLDDENILAELTATARVGLHRYTFPAASPVGLITLDLNWRDEVLDSELRIVSDTRIEGYRRSKSWAKDQIVYFVAEFSKPFAIKATFMKDEAYRTRERLQGKDIKAVFRFGPDKTATPILLKVALSPVSIEGARKNLEAELDHWDFEKVRSDAQQAWNTELSKIEVTGGTDAQLTNFYTALYHTMIAPNIFQDVDGKYLGMDRKIHHAPPGTNYTIFSLWDTFRATHPLYTIIDEKRTVDFINTFIRHYEQGGKLPVWELAANETDTMIGYHAVSVIADAMAKGIKGFDYQKAYEAAKHSSELDIEGLDSYRRRGYISMEDEQESVSRTLEYAYNDYCLAVMAYVLSEKDTLPDRRRDYQKHLKRSQNYKNLFDRETGFMRPKQNGNWISPFAPNDVTFHFTEGNSWQYSFFVPHDVSGLMKLHGGKLSFGRKLDALFTADSNLIGRDQPDITGLIGQYAHGNEPSHHIAYLYNYAGEPWNTQFYVRHIMDEFYKPAPDGLIGNEDCGQMSAWYVLSALGFYQVNPSDPVYAIGTPIFEEAKIHLENGRTFTIKARSGRDFGFGPFVKSVKLNGSDHRRSFLTHSDIRAGGTMEFELSNAPERGWFTEPPVSSVEMEFPPVPTIEARRVFKDMTKVKISSPEKDVKIFYTLDESEPHEESARYLRPFTIDRTTTVKAIAIYDNFEKSFVTESKLNKMPNDWEVSLFSTYSRQYTGGGPEGLIDGLRGTTNFASGEWQGYQGQDFIAVIDLKRQREIKRLGGGFLQVARSWIWMPTRVEFEVSSNGKDFVKAAELETNFPESEMTNTAKDYFRNIDPVTARYVRVKAANLGRIPDWHPGAGFEAYIFVDEIFID